MPTKPELIASVLELEKRRAILLNLQDKPGALQMLALGLGLSGALVCLSLLAWLLAMPIRGHGTAFALGSAALAFLGFVSAGLIHAARPRLSVAEAAELVDLERALEEQRAEVRRLS